MAVIICLYPSSACAGAVPSFSPRCGENVPLADLSDACLGVADLLCGHVRLHPVGAIDAVFRLDVEIIEHLLPGWIGFAFELKLIDGRIARHEQFGKEISYLLR